MSRKGNFEGVLVFSLVIGSIWLLSILFFSCVFIFNLINFIFFVRNYMIIFLFVVSFTLFFSCINTLLLLTVMFAVSSKSAVLCFKCALYISNSLATIIRCDRIQGSICNKSYVLLEYIELSILLNQFEIFVSGLMHENNIENCLF